MPRLEVVATLGPASAPQPVFQQLVRLADGLRLNASHLSAHELMGWLERLSQAFDAQGRVRPVVIDLQGAKMRLGRLEPRACLPDEIELRDTEEVRGSTPALPVPHPRLYAAVRPGERLSLNDRRVVLEVLRVAPGRIDTRVLRNGPVAARQGLNREEHPIPLDRLTEADVRAIEVGSRFAFTHFALSFVHTGAELGLLRDHTDRPCVAKVERPETLAHLEALAVGFDALWLCRGDLGAQAGLRALGPLQERVTRALPTLACPVLLAGQVLHHMCSSPRPTRSEVVHLHDVATRGFAGVVLSDETAVGAHPVEVLRVLAALGHGPQAEIADGSRRA